MQRRARRAHTFRRMNACDRIKTYAKCLRTRSLNPIVLLAFTQINALHSESKDFDNTLFGVLMCRLRLFSLCSVVQAEAMPKLLATRESLAIGTADHIALM